MKKILLIVVVCILGAVVYTFFAQKSLLGSSPRLYLYTVDGKSTGQLSISIPFTDSSDDDYSVSVGVDTDQNGTITEHEWQIRDMRVHLIQQLKSNFWITDAAKALSPTHEVFVSIQFQKAGSTSLLASLEKKVIVEPFEIGKIWGFDIPSTGEDIKRGIGLPGGIIPVVFADDSQAQEPVFRDAMTPDLAQNRMECAAVSAANNLMSLAGEHDRLDDLPAFTGPLIEELKTDMKFNNGISLDNMVIGKNAFTKRHNLPISTELKFAPTKEDILAALRSGAAVELSFSFVRSASGRRNTGHVVTLMGASQGELFVHDSGTPEGMDTLRMFGTVQTPKHTFINVPYPLWDGVAFIDGIVIQNWTDPQHAAESYTDPGEQASEVEMLVINGHYFPKSFFRVANPDACKGAHYHAVNADDIAYGLKDKTSLEIVSLKDPNRNSCGFGKVSEVPVEKITITFEQSQQLSRYLPN